MAKKMSSRSNRNRSQKKSRNNRSRSRNQRKQNRRNRNHNQRGGMAEWASNGDYTLIGPDARVSAQVGPLDSAFGELSSVIPQRGGRFRSRSRKNKRTHSRKRNHSRRQHGGMAPFGDTGRTLTSTQYAADGTNPQFRTETSVNERYSGF